MENMLNNKRAISLILFLLYLGSVWIAAQETPRQYITYKTVEDLKIDGLGTNMEKYMRNPAIIWV